MKIAYCIEGTFNSGGMERILSIKANYLVEHFSYDVTIVTTDQKSRPPFFEFNDKIKHLDLGLNYADYRAKNIFYRKFISNIKQLHKKRLTELLEREKFDIIVSMFDADSLILSKLRCSAIKVLELHFSRYSRLHHDAKRLLNPYLRWRDDRTVARYDQFVVLTNEDRKWWNGCEKIQVIHNPLTLKSSKTAALENKVVCSAGRFVDQKGYDRLIAAWAKVQAAHNDWRLNLYGGGPLQSQVERQIAELGVQNSVTIHSPTTKIDEVFANSSIYAMSSRYEGMPLVLIEAMSVGLPCVSFDCPCGPSEVIDDGRTGIVVPNGDIDQLADGIIKLIEDENLRKAMGRTAKEDIAQRFNLDHIMGQWKALFEGIIDKNSKNGQP